MARQKSGAFFISGARPQNERGVIITVHGNRENVECTSVATRHVDGVRGPSVVGNAVAMWLC